MQTAIAEVSNSQTTSSQPFRVVHLPVYTDNPYQSLLMNAQRELGWEVIDGGGGGNFLRTALRNWRPCVLHFHWLHPYILRTTWLRSWTRGIRFLCEVRMLRKSGAKAVWTVHNLSNHEDRHVSIERSITRKFARQCDLIFTHGNSAVDIARAQFDIPESIPVRAIPHMNYCHLNQEESGSLSREPELRPRETTVAFLGRVQPYKQVVELVQAFRSCADARHRLLIHGLADPDYAVRVEQAIGRDCRISFENRYVPDAELRNVLQQCDLVACPSQGILTSGSVVLAMSFGKPVLAPADGCIPETVGDEGFLYDATQPQGLREGLARALSSGSQLRQMGQRARTRVRDASPMNVAQEHCAAYATLLSSN